MTDEIERAIRDEVMTLESNGSLWVLAEDYRAILARAEAAEAKLAAARSALDVARRVLDSLDGLTAAQAAKIVSALARIDADAPASPAPVTVEEAARMLLDRWLCGAFEDGADSVADDAITAQWAHVDRTFPDAGPVIEAWLRALAGGKAMTDKQFRERALHILHNMALERTGWRGFFRRWHISDEPLRHDAANLIREVGYAKRVPNDCRLVGERKDG
jgi:hypothetical protein